MTSPVRTVLITGATDGLGRALACGLAGEGWRVIVHGRDPAKVGAVVAEVSDITGAPAAAGVVADLSSLAQVRGVVARVASVTDHLDAFVSNAGIGSGEPDGTTRQVSTDGYELRFAVNYLAGFALTTDLLALLRATGAGARIVYVASLGQAPIDWDDVLIERGYSGGRAYGQSKLAQITSGFTWAPLLEADGITVNSLHPSTYMPTKMVLQSVGHSIDTLEAGEAATRRLVSDPALDGVTGMFYDRLREARAEETAYDPEVQQRLWDLSVHAVRPRD